MAALPVRQRRRAQQRGSARACSPTVRGRRQRRFPGSPASATKLDGRAPRRAQRPRLPLEPRASPRHGSRSRKTSDHPPRSAASLRPARQRKLDLGPEDEHRFHRRQPDSSFDVLGAGMLPRLPVSGGSRRQLGSEKERMALGEEDREGERLLGDLKDGADEGEDELMFRWPLKRIWTTVCTRSRSICGRHCNCSSLQSAGSPMTDSKIRF